MSLKQQEGRYWQLRIVMGPYEVFDGTVALYLRVILNTMSRLQITDKLNR